MSSRARQSANERRKMPIWPIVCFLIMFILMIGGLLYFARRTPVHEIPVYPTMDSLGPVYTDSSDEIIKVYIFTDPDYGQQYLVTDHGGITPRLRE